MSIRQMIGQTILGGERHLLRAPCDTPRDGRSRNSTCLALLERATLVLADDEDLLVFQFRKTGHDGPVVAEGPVAVQLDELVKDQFDVVERLRAVSFRARCLTMLQGSRFSKVWRRC